MTSLNFQAQAQVIMSKGRQRTVVSESQEIVCNACKERYKSTDLETFKCTFCKSRDISKGDFGTIKHNIPDGEIDEEY